MTGLSPSKLIKTYLSHNRNLKGLDDPIIIEVPRLEAAPYVDIVDGILSMLRRKDWRWQDTTGATRPGANLLQASLGIARDIVCFPWQATYHLQRLKRLTCSAKQARKARLDIGGLYLRTDHSFDLKSGGSVTHTAGVINSMRTLLPHLWVLSSDKLATVEPNEDFHILTPQYQIGRNLPLMPTLTYSAAVAKWVLSSEIPQPDFVYSRYSVGNYAGLEISDRLSIPYVCEYNGSEIWMARNWGGRPLRFESIFKRVEDANLRSADLIVVVSEASKSELTERGYSEKNILVNPNGVDTNEYRPDIPAQPIRSQLGIDANDVVIGFIGTFGPWHGVEVLAEAFGRLLNTNPSLGKKVWLLLIGDGVTMAKTKKILSAHNATDRAIFTGLIPQSFGPKYLAACDILASPNIRNNDNSRFFGSPTKLFEYMAMGRAIVASNLEQIGEILTDEVSAKLVEPGNAIALEKALEHVASSQAYRQKLATEARSIAVNRYTWRQHTQRILDRIYNDTAGAQV